jgi:hypothetical protein
VIDEWQRCEQRSIVVTVRLMMNGQVNEEENVDDRFLQRTALFTPIAATSAGRIASMHNSR